ncbi:MAG: hypothetical protein SF029_26450 [bacterium]|nr:hypothetical protein [bacterium]
MEENNDSPLSLIGPVIAGILVLVVVLLISLMLLFLFVILPGASGASRTDAANVDTSAETIENDAAPEVEPTAEVTVVPSSG